MYDGSIQAVKKAAGSHVLLHQVLDGVQGTTPEVVKSAVENPIPKLTLKDTLEKKPKRDHLQHKKGSQYRVIKWGQVYDRS